MECKDVELALNEVQNAVLIETSWNVKYFCPNFNIFIKSVLIETSWNVKLKGVDGYTVGALAY